MKYINSITSILVISMMVVTISDAQNLNLPLTAIGLGERKLGMNAAQYGMAGLNSTYYDANRYNLNNPASLAHLRSASLGLGAYALSNTFEENNRQETQWDGSIDYLHIAFPLQNIFNESFRESPSAVRIGAAFSLVPYSSSNYSVLSLDTDTNTSRVFSGDGELYAANASVGASYKNLSFGMDLGFLFGSYDRNTQLIFDPEVALYTTNFSINSGYKAFNYKLGAMYSYVLNPGLDEKAKRNNNVITLGATFKGSSQVNTNTDEFNYTSFVDENVLSPEGRELTRDTLLLVQDQKRSFDLPLSYSVGLSYSHGDKWLIGVDYSGEKWASVEANYLNGSFVDAFRLSGGVQFVPDIRSFNSYFNKIHYRAGVFQSKDYRTFDSRELSQRGFTVGLGLPIYLARQKTTFVDLSFELGEYEIENFSEAKNNYFRINLGLTINDNTWFFKQKYQ